MPLLRLIDITDGLSLFETCVLRLQECNALNTCPMHCQMEAVKKMKAILADTAIGDLLKEDKRTLSKAFVPLRRPKL